MNPGLRVFNQCTYELEEGGGGGGAGGREISEVEWSSEGGGGGGADDACLKFESAIPDCPAATLYSITCSTVTSDYGVWDFMIVIILTVLPHNHACFQQQKLEIDRGGMKKSISGQRSCQRKVVKHTDEQKSTSNQKVEE